MGDSSLRHLTCVCAIYVVLLSTCLGFNVDTRTAIVHRGPVGSMFGFSVALYKDQTSTWALVGAPKAQTNQPNVTEGGAVYRCSTESSPGCYEIPFDLSGPNYDYRGTVLLQSDEKSRQWFGATVDSSETNSLVVACAPRYVYFSPNFRRREPVGACWIARNSMRNFEEYSPCRSPSTWGYHSLGHCQAGMSAALTQDGGRLFVGAVGSYHWQGQVFSKSLQNNGADYQSSESPAQYDDSFLGYASAVGEFTGDDSMDVVVGMPRGNNLTGKVVLLNESLHNLKNISGEQMGSYFGYSICVADVNGDKFDDIIVGAPLFTDFESKESQFEEGRVYVIYQNSEHNFETMDHLDGEYAKGRFGLALASLKDINRDGFEDFAVGAPYAGQDGKGLLYVYHGSPSGIRDKPSQIISPSDLSDIGLSTLGFSVSGGIDIDGNDYPDILIGAYDSDRAVFMKSRPVVNITSKLTLSTDVVSLDDKSCVLRKNTTRVTCLKTTLCLVYNGIGVNSEIDIAYNITLDSEQRNSRALFINRESSTQSNTVRLRKNIRYCNTSDIYVQNGIRDKLTPIAIKADYALVDLEPYRYVLKPILNGNVPSHASKELNIEKNCGKDNVCIPDLQLIAAANVDQFSIGSAKRLELEVVIHNAGEDAFESMLYVSMPLDVNFVNINKTKLDFPISCSGAQPEFTGVNELVCDIGNPLPANKTLNFRIILAPSRVVSSVRQLVFTMVANSTNEELEETLYNNEEVIELPVRVEVSLAVSGISRPATVAYNSSQQVPANKVGETDIGPEVIHVYEVGNRGPSSVREAEVYILWPSYTLDEKPLLYMMDQPEIKGSAKCDPVENVNPLGLQRLRRQPRHKNDLSIKDMKKYSLLNEIQVKEQNKLHRKKREDDFFADEGEDAYLLDEEVSFADRLSCGPTLCTQIHCTISNLEKNEQVIFSIRSRLWRDTYNEFGLSEVQTSSEIITRITALPYGVDPSYLPYKVFTISTKVILEGIRAQPYMIPWWIIVLAICCGLLLLLLLALLLWKLGFFKRKRPQEMPEKEPLNERNGYRMASGDAAL